MAKSKPFPPNFKLVIVGDTNVGKTHLLYAYATNKYPVYCCVPENFEVDVILGKTQYKKNNETEHDAIIREQKNNQFEELRKPKRKNKCVINDRLKNANGEEGEKDEQRRSGQQSESRVTLHLFDSGGGEDYERLRPLIYPQIDVFLLAFDVANENSFHRIADYYWPEISLQMPKTPFLIVGMKSDLRGRGCGGGEKGGNGGGEAEGGGNSRSGGSDGGDGDADGGTGKAGGCDGDDSGGSGGGEGARERESLRADYGVATGAAKDGVETKKDAEKCVSRERGMAMAAQLKAVKYVECSALNYVENMNGEGREKSGVSKEEDGVEIVFLEAAKAALARPLVSTTSTNNCKCL